MAEKLVLEFLGKDEVTKTTKSITSSLGGLGSVAAGAATAGLAVAATAAVAAGAAIVNLVADAMPLEGVQAAFEGITTAAGTTADAVLSDFKNFSGNMITNADAMASFNQAAQLVSDEFALQLPEAMGYLSKVSAATGEDVGFMLDSMVKGVGRLSPMILDNLGIQVNLTEANEAYAAQLGISAGELTKSQQQTALMNQVMEKLAANTAAMPEVTGTAAAAWGSFQTTLTDTKDTIGLALLPVVTPLLQAFADLAAKILPPLAGFIVEKLIPALITLGQWFGEKIIPLLVKTKDEIVTAVGPAFKEIKGAVDSLSGALGITTGSIDVLDAIFFVLKGTLQGMVTLVKASMLVWQGVAAAIRAIASAIEFVVDKFHDMQNTINNLSIPSWLTPGSPTPFELGLVGIGKAMDNLNFGGVSLGGGGFARAGVGGGGMTTVSVVVNYSPVMSLGDRYEAETRLAPLLENILRQKLEHYKL